MREVVLQRGFVWRPIGRRPAVAALVVASTITGALILHGIHASPTVCPRGSICAWGTGPEPFSQHPIYPRPGWGDPWALAVCCLGFAGAAAVLLKRRRQSVAVLVLGSALAGATVLYFQNQLVSDNCPSHLAVCSGPLQAGWFGGLLHVDFPAAVFHPAALVVALLGVAGAAFVLLKARRPRTGAALILGATLLSAAVLQVVAYPGGYLTCGSYFAGARSGPPSRPDCVQVESRAWVDPATLALCVLGAAGAGGVLAAARRRNPR
jgi:hypothetical protein